jgi:hypothetical protein
MVQYTNYLQTSEKCCKLYLNKTCCNVYVDLHLSDPVRAPLFVHRQYWC